MEEHEAVLEYERARAREEGRREGRADGLLAALNAHEQSGKDGLCSCVLCMRLRRMMDKGEDSWCPSLDWQRGQQAGRAACTADVVALLAGGRTAGGEVITSAKHAASVILRGEHVGAAGKGKL